MSPPDPHLRYLGSTYRLQLHGVGFLGARDLVGYLSDLGIETLYVSPVLAAAPGSTHGYDVIDPGRLDPALGSPAEFEALLRELEAHRMRLLIDMVPNHMAAVPANRWWWEVLREGREAEHAPVFDIDWTQHGGRVLVPTLGRPLADAMDEARYVDRGGGSGERELELDGQRFPLAPGTRAGYDPVAALARQHYRPAYWRLSNHEGNYRRFFDIDGLVGVRVEDAQGFERTHDFLLELGADERIAGWRVDHIDGLADPAAYLRRWAAALADRRRSRAVVVVEKILAPDEVLRPDWPVDGTTGYEFANLAGGLFVHDAGGRLLARAAQEMTGAEGTFADLARQAKREVLAMSFPAALGRVVRATLRALDDHHPGHDLSADSVRAALTELTVQLDVYRTYLGDGAADQADRDRLDRAAAAANGATLQSETARALGLIVTGFAGAEDAWLAAVRLWQQLTGAVMAKGAEDTAIYRYPGLLSQADVGGDPDQSAAGPEQFHGLAQHQLRYPSTLNATSTHDSKRSEDSRARLFTLSELPAEWAGLVGRWHRRYRAGGTGPDALDEWVAYQSLFCLWPHDRTTVPPGVRRRVQDYMVKAAREAKRHTSWVDPHPDYERVLTRFVGRLCRDGRFGAEMARFVRRIGPAAATNSLSMLILKTIAPGVPDVYQGAELWDYALTDPDNRRPVDFTRRRSLLAALPALDAPPAGRTGVAQTLLSDWGDGRLKLQLTRSLLHLRRDHAELFARGEYFALKASGPAAHHVVGLARHRRRRWVIALVPRQVIGVAGPGRFPVGTRTWGTTALRLPVAAPGTFTDVVTGASVTARRGRLALAECLDVLPVAVLLG